MVAFLDATCHGLIDMLKLQAKLSVRLLLQPSRGAYSINKVHSCSNMGINDDWAAVTSASADEMPPSKLFALGDTVAENGLFSYDCRMDLLTRIP